MAAVADAVCCSRWEEVDNDEAPVAANALPPEMPEEDDAETEVVEAAMPAVGGPLV